jgi:hypothetical protein
MTDYNNGQIWGWNGGDCPVHPETEVRYWLREDGASPCCKASELDWKHLHRSFDIIAFRVVKAYVEPKVVWVNEYKEGCEWTVYSTKDEATESAAPYATRIAVKYVEAKDD